MCAHLLRWNHLIVGYIYRARLRHDGVPSQSLTSKRRVRYTDSIQSMPMNTIIASTPVTSPQGLFQALKKTLPNRLPHLC